MGSDGSMMAKRCMINDAAADKQAMMMADDGGAGNAMQRCQMVLDVDDGDGDDVDDDCWC